VFNIIGDIFGSSGYAVHTRNLANALAKKAEVRLTTQLPPNWNMNVNDKELEMIKKSPQKDEINIIITNPIYWKLNLGTGRNWVFLIWEGDKVPESILRDCMDPRIEKILVASNHSKLALLRTAADLSENWSSLPMVVLPDKIKLVPHGVDLSLFYPTEKPKKCTFLCNKGLRNIEDRGGIQYLLKAFVEEFTDEDVELIVKLNPAYGLVDINQIMNQMNVPIKKHPKITVIDQDIKYSEMFKVYNMANVFVSPTRAEAFNIPCIEAMACGLPVITTDFGGQTDYVTLKNGWRMSGELTEVKGDLMYEEVKWLTPDITELRQILRHVFERPELIIEKGVRSLETAKEYQWDNSANILLALVALQS